jgi:hypothetical protein
MSIDGTPISGADLARIEAEEKLHTDQQRSAVRVVASAALDADDCRTLLSILGLEGEIVVAARAGLHPVRKPVAKAAAGKSAAGKRPRKRRAA